MVINLKSFHEVNPVKKNLDWADGMVRYMRQYLQPIVSPDRYYKNMRILRGDYAMEKCKKLFKDWQNSGVEFNAIAVMEKIRLIIIAENENAGIHVSLKASDPTAVNQSQRDKELLSNQRLIEAHMSYMRQSIGLPPFSMKGQTGKDGKPLFNGDVEGLEKMGLNVNSAEDVDYYWSTFYRLRHEIKAEEVINFFLAYNEMDNMIGPMINDILAVKRLAYQTYVDEMTGAIKYRYLCPANVRAMKCKSRDFKDTKAICFEEEMSVNTFISMIGNDFEYQTDMRELLQAANAANNTSYTYVSDEAGLVYCGDYELGRGIQYSQFLEQRIIVGYIEWKSIDSDTYKVTARDENGNLSVQGTKPTAKVSKDSNAQIETKYNEVVYKSYYLSQGNDRQKLYRFGRLSYPELEGADDEYSNFSICAYAEWGKPAAEIAEPYIDAIQKAWVKFQHVIAVAKPPGRAYNYDSLVKIASAMMPELGEKQGVLEVMKMFFDGVNEIWSIPTTDEGDPIGGSGQSSFELPNGLSKSALDFKTVLDYNFAMINDQLGISSLREAGTPDPRDGYKLSMQALQYSHNATQYVRSMLITTIDNVVKRTLLFTQEIVRYRSVNSTAYKFMVRALGDETINDIDTLGDVALHRYGIFVEALNTKYEKEQALQHAQLALTNKEIDYQQYLLILSVRSHKRMLQILGYEKKRKERMDREAIEAQNQHLQQMAQIASQEKIGIEDTRGKYSVATADKTGEWLYKVEELKQQGIVNKEVAKKDAEPGLIDNRKEAKIAEAEAHADLEAQKPLMS